MTIANFGELKTAVADWANRQDLSDSRLGDFVRAAHDRIVREAVVSADLVVDDDTVALPSDFGRAISVWLSGYPRQLLSSATSLQMTDLGTDVPAYYRISGTDILFAPTPDATYAGKILYKLISTPFSADEDTNAVLTRYPFAYLYAALSEVANYLQDPDMQGRNEGLYGQTLASLNAKEQEDASDGPLQMSTSTTTAI